MTTFGMVVRADQGGLATQTYEVAWHLRPDVVIIMDLEDKGRGECEYDRYGFVPDVTVVRGTVLGNREAEQLAAKCEVIYGAETFYGSALWRATRGLRDVTPRPLAPPLYLHVNPELWRDEEADQYLVPTKWEMGRIPNAQLLYQPIPIERFSKRFCRDQAQHFVHFDAPAMLDREGTETLLAALEFIQSPCEITIRTWRPEHHMARHPSHVKLNVVNDRPHDYRDLWSENYDCVIMPRRYAGQSLIMNEAMGHGLAVLASDIEPHKSFLHPWSRVPTIDMQRVPMRGGKFEVHNFNPRDLARRIDQLVAHPEAASFLSQYSLDYSASRSWTALEPKWREVLGLD